MDSSYEWIDQILKSEIENLKQIFPIIKFYPRKYLKVWKDNPEIPTSKYDKVKQGLIDYTEIIEKKKKIHFSHEMIIKDINSNKTKACEWLDRQINSQSSNFSSEESVVNFAGEIFFILCCISLCDKLLNDLNNEKKLHQNNIFLIEIQKWKDLLGKAELEKLFNIMKESNILSSEQKNKLIPYEFRWSNNENQNNKGTIKPEDYRTEQNNIALSMNDFILKIEKTHK